MTTEDVAGGSRYPLDPMRFLVVFAGWLLFVFAVYSGFLALQFGDDGYLTYMVVLGVVAAIVFAVGEATKAR